MPAAPCASVTSIVPSSSQSISIVPPRSTVTSYVGVLSLVMLSVLLTPVSLAPTRSTVTPAVRSISTPSAADGAEVLPATSTARTV